MREKLIALSMVKKGDWSEIHRFLRKDRKLSSIDDAVACQLVDQLKYEAVTIFDQSYPDAWKEMSKPPFVVYLNGSSQLLRQNIIAIIGGKLASETTKQSVRFLLGKLPNDVCVMTGLERGVEVYSSEYAKRKIACLASGFLADELYQQHRGYAKFTEADLLISELPPTAKFDLQAYYRAYHLLAELSQVVCVFELASFDLRVKYLNYLAEVGKSMVVLPDKKTKHTAGGLGLINLGAKCLLQPSDVLALL